MLDWLFFFRCISNRMKEENMIHIRLQGLEVEKEHWVNLLPAVEEIE